ncbi:hypothetical protein SATMO3_35290 [Sporomusa aerivorans]
MEKWYYKTWFVITMLVLFFPIRINFSMENA